MVLAKPPCGPTMMRSRSTIFVESGSQICGSLLTRNLGALGTGPDHLTVPEIVPPSATVTTLYSLCAKSAADAAKMSASKREYLKPTGCVSVICPPSRFVTIRDAESRLTRIKSELGRSRPTLSWIPGGRPHVVPQGIKEEHLH